MPRQKKTICIISSFYNEKENLKKFILSFDKVKNILSQKGYKVMLAMVNDGSTDNSINIVKKLKNERNYIKIINLTKNYGQQIAIFTAIKKFDADLYGAIDQMVNRIQNILLKCYLI